MKNLNMFDADKKKISKKFEDSTSLMKLPEELRARAEKNGYLFFKHFFEPEKMLKLRREMLQIVDKFGYLSPNANLIEGIADINRINRVPIQQINENGNGVPLSLYKEVQKLQSFHAITHDPKLKDLFRMLFEDEPFPHPRNIARIMLPHKDAKPTPSHQDFLHIQGTEHTWTCWAPLGDVPMSLGGLTVLEGSHKAGLLDVTTGHEGAGGLETILCNLGYEWAGTDYEIGDMLTFPSLTVHKSIPNKQRDRIRLSIDVRLQPISQPIEARSLLPHGPFTWEELYEGWEREELQYYWSNISFDYIPWNEKIRWQKEKLC
ncbi:phytanoyl-CoA dioxygenase family protein [Paenibacillus sp. J5C_2022]|uniref:phytanoyl-CoA dioxygenase family protein n=1 Tax=Paenibacillus sp. J5C2022 TaxID=2977129 RepID=UPI0021CFC7BB|nr:phytanoyl-CoA dioxygenase family protein [Paenibacillus sp. J5C2022]MCU6712558.1 phytanoyl-CoA dioxygenase family protein [Paenibacillus sp. J5C2022]